MAIFVTNSLSRQKEEFQPLEPGKVRMYVCGPTVYGPSHIGHARTYIAFDVIRRYLEYSGYDVTFVCNITDVHDDMIKRANELNTTIKELADVNYAQYRKDMDSLNVLDADYYPRVTEYIQEIIDMVQILEQKGYAYPTEDGSVYFDLAKFEGYGQLSGIKPEQGKTGTRVETDKYEKENVQDFALWKGAKPGEPTWDSPWGAGRPGWHIECSVMSQKLLGKTIDIHGGAIDLIFPHHENEIAQSEAASGKKPFVKYWMHSGLLRIEGEKMSKSLGNFIEIPELLQEYDPMVVRLYLLQSHYKSSLNFTRDGLDEAKKRLARWHDFLDPLTAEYGDSAQEYPLDLKADFTSRLDDDFNTPQAIALIEEVIKSDKLSSPAKHAALSDFNLVLGLQLDQISSATTCSPEQLEQIESLVKQREQLRAEGKFAEADRIRETLEQKFNVIVKDDPKGSSWSIKC